MHIKFWCWDTYVYFPQVTHLCYNFYLQQEANTERLTAFINVLNGKDGNLSRLVSIPPGPSLSDALISSPVVVGEDGAGAMDIGSGFEFGVDPNADPELALVKYKICFFLHYDFSHSFNLSHPLPLHYLTHQLLFKKK